MVQIQHLTVARAMFSLQRMVSEWQVSSFGKAVFWLAVCLLALSVSCGRRKTPVEIGDREGILHVGCLSEPKDLDPHTVTGVTEFNIVSSLLEGLVGEDPRDLHPIPAAAESWKVSEDRCVYTFHLRQEAKWSNGDPLTAADFVFSFSRILSPEQASPYAYMLFPLRNAEAFHKGHVKDFSEVGVEALDSRTLRLILTHPVPHFLSLLNHHSWFPVHPPTIQKFADNTRAASLWTRPGNYVGNGPFVLISWEPGKKIVVRKSDTYWDHDRVRLREIHFYPIGDSKTEERAFLAGQLHVTGTVPLDRIAHYREKHPEWLRLNPYLGCYYYLLNVSRPPLDDVRVRRALALAVNRDLIVTYVTKGGEAPALHFTPPDTDGYTCRSRLFYDPERARSLLNEAGFPGGKGLRRLELLYNTSEAHERIAQVVQQMWRKELGIEVELVNVEWKVYLAMTEAGKYDIARAGWIGDYVDPNTFLDLWVTGGGNNRTGWSNPEYDRLIRAAAREPDRNLRFELFQEAERILMEAVPIIPLYFYRSKALVHPSVQGWHSNILDHHPFKFVYLIPDA
ncbi:MAG: peptide ABC transporter substrate-binding protein [Kiritimatiellia bacterium]